MTPTFLALLDKERVDWHCLRDKRKGEDKLPNHAKDGVYQSCLVFGERKRHSEMSRRRDIMRDVGTKDTVLPVCLNLEISSIWI